MIQVIDELMAIIVLIVVAAFLLVTFPVWMIPYAIYKFWRSSYARAIKAKLKQKNGYAEEKNT